MYLKSVVLPWYVREISKPWSKHLAKEYQRSTRHPFATAFGTSSLIGVVNLPAVAMGASPYLAAAHIAKKGQVARSTLNMYRMGVWQKAQYITGLAKVPKGTATIGTILWSGVPRRAQAVQAARYAKFASRAVPIIGAAALAYDLYDIIVNRSFWGFDFD